MSLYHIFIGWRILRGGCRIISYQKHRNVKLAGNWTADIRISDVGNQTFAVVIQYIKHSIVVKMSSVANFTPRMSNVRHWQLECQISCKFHSFQYPMFLCLRPRNYTMYALYMSCHSVTCHGVASTHWSRHKMAAISRTTLLNAFSWIKILESR